MSNEIPCIYARLICVGRSILSHFHRLLYTVLLYTNTERYQQNPRYKVADDFFGGTRALFHFR